MVENVRQIDFNFGNNENKEYKVETIQDSAVYARELVDSLLRLYYLILQKNYLEEENT